MEEPKDDTVDSLKKTVKEGAVTQKERVEVFINGKNKLPVGTAEHGVAIRGISVVYHLFNVFMTTLHLGG